MSIFNHIDQSKLDAFSNLIQAGQNFTYKPAIAQGALKSGDVVSKATACARFLIEWQNNLNLCKQDPAFQIVNDETQFTQFRESQRALNKLKRKFSKLVIENVDDTQLEILAKKVENKMSPRSQRGKPTQADMEIARYLFRRHGDNTVCLELVGEEANYPLNESTCPLGDITSFLGYDSGQPFPDTRFVFTVASTAEHFPLSANAWGYPGQSPAPFTQYTPAKDGALGDRFLQLRKMTPPKLTLVSPWDKVVKKSGFEICIQNAKFRDGSPAGSCEERGQRVFYRLAKEREFDCLYLDKIKPGDHIFVVGAASDHQNHVLDAWNGAKVYPWAKARTYLQDRTGFDYATGKAEVQLYNPSAQKIYTIAHNIYPLEIFKTRSVTKHPYLIQLLEEFHDISSSQRKEKMLKALEIVRFIEEKMPLYDYVDREVHELYDQMVYLTKKERKNGLTLPPEKDHCPVNEALQNLDLVALRSHLNLKVKMDEFTLFHAIKASLRANDMTFLEEVVNANVPVQRSLLTYGFDFDPKKAILKLAEQLTKDNGTLDFVPLCKKAVKI